MQSACQISAYAHYARTPVLRLKQRTDDFYATVRCRLRHYTKLPWREIKTKNGLQALTKQNNAKKQVPIRKASKALTTVRPARPLQCPATKDTTKNGLRALKKATQRKEASGKSICQIQASSDGNTHKSKHKLRGGGREKQPE